MWALSGTCCVLRTPSRSAMTLAGQCTQVSKKTLPHEFFILGQQGRGWITGWPHSQAPGKHNC